MYYVFGFYGEALPALNDWDNVRESERSEAIEQVIKSGGLSYMYKVGDVVRIKSTATLSPSSILQKLMPVIVTGVLVAGDTVVGYQIGENKELLFECELLVSTKLDKALK